MCGEKFRGAEKAVSDVAKLFCPTEELLVACLIALYSLLVTMIASCIVRNLARIMGFNVMCVRVC